MATATAQPQAGNPDCDYRKFGFPACTGASAELWLCVDCSARICDGCWPEVPGHRKEATARGGRPHEKTDSRRHERLREILNPPVTEDELERLHAADLETIWFGIIKNRSHDPCLLDGGIYNSLIAQCPFQDGPKYPQLVSFIGQTNTGKSTLIKMLIDHAETESNSPSRSSYASPVVGSSIHSRSPTSADVHLYADPRTYSTSKPIFYADAEGLDAGEETPIGAPTRRKSKLHRSRGGAKRVLDWALTEDQRERPYIVSELYPRLLYTFSDVVVFVLRNEKTFEDTGLARLIRWGAASLETSINQPTLPQLVIVVNAATLNVATQQEWDVEYARESLLQSVRPSLEKKTYFRDLAQRWSSKGRRIDSIDDLIRCYYSSFSVVRIPSEGRYALLDKQIGALGDTISACCNDAFNSKRRANMLSNSDELSVFLHSAFDHFARDLQTPFNFIEISRRNNPIPQDFGGHILQLAIALHKQDPEKDGRKIFSALSYFVASSVLLDCVRHRKGLPLEHVVDYDDYFDYALEEYCKYYSPCMFANDKGRCVNTRSAHDSKGHQNSKGRIIASGPYKSDFTFDRYIDIWDKTLDEEILSYQTKLGELRDRANQDVVDETHALRLHAEAMNRFYHTNGTAKEFRSHTVCFSCLMGVPQHSLPCGHVLCSSCVKGFGKTSNGFEYSLRGCPLHEHDCAWVDACIIRFKPDLAGVRVLSLDGGGIRGIVELEVLRAIQKVVGDGLPIRAFFDLIVGTSTGGIIALALGRNWTIDKCIREFRKLCRQAFTPRALHSIPILQQLRTLSHGSKYKTKQFHDALETALGNRRIFGGLRETDTIYTPKVAVTSTNEEGRKAVVIANYNRNSTDTESRRRNRSLYEFQRPDDPSCEMKYWEAAAATAAAPPYFKAFYHGPTRRSYLDGAFYNNNPARIAEQERKVLWPDIADSAPDIFLSIGTSKDSRQLNREIRAAENARQSSKHSNQRSSIIFPRWYQLFNAAHGRMDNILDAESSWREFLSNSINGQREDRYVRINPNIGSEPPELDAVDQIESLREAAKRGLRRERRTIQDVARSLISSSFYFELTAAPSPTTEEAGGFKCTGKILCRLEGYLRAFGDYFLLQQRPGFQPYFEVSEDAYDAPKQQLDLSPEIINRMKEQGAFDLNPFNIMLSSRTARVNIILNLMPTGSLSGEAMPHPISGFPKTLISEASSGRIPPIRKTPNTRSRKRRFRASTGSLPQAFGHSPRLQASRSFSLPMESRTALTSPVMKSELDAFPKPVQQNPTLSHNISNIVSDRARRSSSLENRAGQVPPPTLPKERETRAQATVQSSSIRRPAVSNNVSGASNSVELPVEPARQSEAPRERRRVSLQPSTSTLQAGAREISPTSDTMPTVRSGTTYQDELRRRRRRPNVDPPPEEPVTQTRVYERPALTQRSRTNQKIVRERGPLSDLERSLDSRHRRSSFHGYASEEDVSQLGSSVVSEMKD